MMAIWKDNRGVGIRQVLTAVDNDVTVLPTAAPAGIDLNQLAHAIQDARNRVVHCEAELCKVQKMLHEAEAAFRDAVRRLGIKMGD